MKTLVALGGNNMYKDYGIKAQEIMVDEDDYEYLKQYRWVILNGYAVTRDVSWKGKDGKQTVASMHRMIAAKMDAGVYERGVIVKFKDGNRWNCQRNNLFMGRRDNKMDANFKILEMIRMQINGDEMDVRDEKKDDRRDDDVRKQKIRDEVMQKLKRDKDENLIKKYFTSVEDDNGEVDVTKFKI